MGTPSESCIQKLTSFCWCRQVSQIASVKARRGQGQLPANCPQENPNEDFLETILINPTDLEESIIHILLAIRDGTKEVLPLNTNHKFKVEHFQITLLKSFYIQNQSIQQWASKSAVTMVLQ